MAGMLTLAALAVDPDRFHLIDVRDAEDYATAHVAGAVIFRWQISQTGRVNSLTERRQ